jgi:hypothetical protein
MFDELLRGIGGASAAVVGFCRGAVEGALLAGLGYLAIYVGNYDFTLLGLEEGLAPLVAGALVLGLRSLEGVADRIDPSK